MRNKSKGVELVKVHSDKMVMLEIRDLDTGDIYKVDVFKNHKTNRITVELDNFTETYIRKLSPPRPIKTIVWE